MGTRIIIALLGFVLAILLDAFLLILATMFFKVKNATDKKALKISVIFITASLILAVIISVLFSAINIGFLGNIVVVVAGFFIANFLYKKYYQTETTKNIKIYLVKSLLSGVGAVVIGVLIVVPIRMFLFQPFLMEGASMEPNIKNGQYMIFQEYDKNYQREEVIVFKYPKNPSQFFLKRIVGLPNEKVEIKNNAVYVNSKLLSESYLAKDVKTFGDTSITLASDEYFVMGDNRAFSSDSRVWGPVKKNLVIGKYWTTLRIPTD